MHQRVSPAAYERLREIFRRVCDETPAQRARLSKKVYQRIRFNSDAFQDTPAK